MNLDRSIDYFLTAKRAEGRSDMTIRAYSQALYRLARMEVISDTDEIDAFTMREFIRRLQDEGLSKNTVSNYTRHVRVWVAWLEGEEVIRTNPFEKRVKVPQTESMNFDVITDDEFKALLGTANLKTNKGRRDAALLAFLYDTGVRIAEACDLKVDAVDLKARQAKVYGKGGKYRVVFFSPHTALALTRYISRRKLATAYVFAGTGGSNAGDRIETNGARQLLNRLCDRAGIRHINPHLFRHTFATNFLRMGGDIHMLQRILGHADVSTTVRNYAHLMTDDLATAHDRFSPMSRVMQRR